MQFVDSDDYLPINSTRTLVAAAENYQLRGYGYIVIFTVFMSVLSSLWEVSQNLRGR